MEYEGGFGAALGVEVGLGEGGRVVMEGILGVDVEGIEGVGVLFKGLEELVLELDGVVVLFKEVEELMVKTAARTVDDLETSVITVIVE